MKRATLLFLSFAALGWISGCGGSSGSGGIGGGGNPTPNNFTGQYAFLLAGFDSNGNPLGIAGSVKADGLGHITAGEVDVNDNGTASTSNAVTGSYSFDSTGQSTLGTITLTNTVSGVAHPLGFGFSLQTSGDFGQIMSLDSNGFVAAGTVQQQSSAVFSLSAMAGSYVVTINGRNSTSPTSILGRVTFSAGGAGSAPSFDRSIAGVGTSGPTTSAQLNLGSSGPDTNGRGTFTLALNDGLASTSQTFAYYAITATRFIAVETDGNGTMTADFAGQGASPSVVTAGSVFGMAGIDTVAGNEISSVGQLQITGAGSTGGTLHWDANDAGNIFNVPSLGSLAVAYNSATGRGTISVTNGTATGLADTAVFYLDTAGGGFIMDGTAGATNRAMAGPLMPQASGSFSASTDLGGLGIVRSRGSSVNDALSLIGLFGLQSGSTTNYSLLFDDRFPNNGIQTQLDTSISPITLAGLDTNLGRGTLSVPNGTATNSTWAFYLIGPNQFDFIDISPISSGVNGATSVFFVSPH